MLRISGLDVCADARCPVGDDRRVAVGTTWFVAQFPRENGRRILVSVDDEVDVSEISSLRAFVGEERGRASAVIIDVSINATKVI